LTKGAQNLAGSSTGKRHQKRVKMVVPVRLCIQERNGSSSHLVHTLDVTHGGTRLGGLQCTLTPGMTVEVQRYNKRAKFRVIWVKSPGEKSRETQVGLQCLEPEKHIWGIDLSAEADNYLSPEK
jgi:hypothetical protein